jgi:predicted kinase
MRKWMRERLKRRKKPTEESQAESKASPLQPAYFDGEPGAKPPAGDQPAEREISEEQTPADVPLKPGMGEAPAPLQSASANASADSRRRGGRRRRGRGGQRRSGTPPGRPSNDGEATALPEARPGGPQIPPAQPAVPKGAVVLAIGLPGSGKSSWFKRHKITPLSSDMLRSLLFDDPTEQRFQDLIFSNLRSMLKARLLARRPLNYVDATNLTPHERHNWVKLAKDFGYEAQAVFFDVPLQVCLERNQRRERVVSEDVMRRMADKLKPPTFEEGFSKITVVRVKHKQEEPA